MLNASATTGGGEGRDYDVVIDEPGLVWNKSFMENLDIERLSLDPAQMRAEYAAHAHDMGRCEWPAGWNPEAAFLFNTPQPRPLLQLQPAATS